MKDPTLACTTHWKAQGRGNRAANVRSLLGCETAVAVMKVRVADLIGRRNCGPTTVKEIEAYFDLVRVLAEARGSRAMAAPDRDPDRSSGGPVPGNPGAAREIDNRYPVEKEMSDNDQYLVFSVEHSAWWGPGANGYTDRLSRAGRYSRVDALNISTNAIHGSADRFGMLPEIPVRLADIEGMQEAYTAAYPDRKLERWE
jgi:hypothetical protein